VASLSLIPQKWPLGRFKRKKRQRVEMFKGYFGIEYVLEGQETIVMARKRMRDEHRRS
jgi:beta-galactosidase beta subunit